MMQNLLYKDLSLLSWSLLFYPLFFWVFGSFEANYGSPDFSIAAFLTMNGLIQSVSTASNKNRTDVFIMSLPVTRKELIFSKYIGAALVGLVLILTTLALSSWVGVTFGYYPKINFWGIYLGLWAPIIVGIPLSCNMLNGWANGAIHTGCLFFLFFGIYPLLKLCWFPAFFMVILPVLLFPLSLYMANYWYQKREF